jgi:hypothetical protein
MRHVQSIKWSGVGHSLGGAATGTDPTIENVLVYNFSKDHEGEAVVAVSKLVKEACTRVV